MRKLIVAGLALSFSLLPAAAEDEAFELFTFDISALCTVHPPCEAPLLGPPELTSLDQDYRPEWVQAIEMDAVADLIRYIIRPECWDMGGDVTAREGSLLVVKCPPSVAREIGQLLANLTSATSRRVRVSVETYDVPLSSWLAAGPAVVDPARITGSTRTASLASVAWEGVPAALSLTNRFAWISDYDVEFTAETALADPIVSQADEGLALNLTVWPTMDGSRVLLRAFLQGGRYARPIREMTLGASRPGPVRTLQLPKYGFFTASVSGLVRPGEALVIPMAGAGGIRLAVIRVLGVDGVERAGPFIHTGALTQQEVTHQLHFNGLNPAIRWDPRAPASAVIFGADAENGLIGGGTEDLMDLVTQNCRPDDWELDGVSINPCGPSLVFFGPEELNRSIRGLVAGLEEQLLRTVHVDLRLWSVAGAVDSGPREAFEPGEARFIAEGGTTTLARREAFLVAGDLTDHVADYDVQAIGGGGMPKQVVDRTFAGLAARVKPAFTPDGSALDVALSLLLASRQGPDAHQAGANAILPLELVQTGRLRLDTTLRIPRGKVYVLNAGPDSSAPGRHLALVVHPVAD